ncbi:MAG: LPXTG cell wall anchor domain-containing protein [Promicromonosporaceae bacterium]|nr:LPXTG cell wall anchor domain-containing protein [Promicromonosporaceae bacterium]
MGATLLAGAMAAPAYAEPEPESESGPEVLVAPLVEAVLPHSWMRSPDLAVQIPAVPPVVAPGYRFNTNIGSADPRFAPLAGPDGRWAICYATHYGFNQTATQAAVPQPATAPTGDALLLLVSHDHFLPGQVDWLINNLDEPISREPGVVNPAAQAEAMARLAWVFNYLEGQNSQSHASNAALVWLVRMFYDQGRDSGGVNISPHLARIDIVHNTPAHIMAEAQRLWTLAGNARPRVTTTAGYTTTTLSRGELTGIYATVDGIRVAGIEFTITLDGPAVFDRDAIPTAFTVSADGRTLSGATTTERLAFPWVATGNGYVNRSIVFNFVDPGMCRREPDGWQPTFERTSPECAFEHENRPVSTSVIRFEVSTEADFSITTEVPVSHERIAACEAWADLVRLWPDPEDADWPTYEDGTNMTLALRARVWRWDTIQPVGTRPTATMRAAGPADEVFFYATSWDDLALGVAIGGVPTGELCVPGAYTINVATDLSRMSDEAREVFGHTEHGYWQPSQTVIVDPIEIAITTAVPGTHTVVARGAQRWADRVMLAPAIAAQAGIPWPSVNGVAYAHVLTAQVYGPFDRQHVPGTAVPVGMLVGYVEFTASSWDDVLLGLPGGIGTFYLPFSGWYTIVVSSSAYLRGESGTMIVPASHGAWQPSQTVFVPAEPRVVTEVTQARITEDDLPTALCDDITVSLPHARDQWPHTGFGADASPGVWLVRNDVRGPFDQAQSRRPWADVTPAFTNFVPWDSVDATFTGVGTQRVCTARELTMITVPSPRLGLPRPDSGPFGFYTWTSHGQETALFAAYDTDWWVGEETHSVLGRIRKFSVAHEFNVAPGGRFGDDMTISFMPATQGEFAGVPGWWAPDQLTADIALMGPVREMFDTAVVPEGTPEHGRVTVAAGATSITTPYGMWEVGFGDLRLPPAPMGPPGEDWWAPCPGNLRMECAAGYYVFVLDFAGDARTEPFLSRADDERQMARVAWMRPRNLPGPRVALEKSHGTHLPPGIGSGADLPNNWNGIELVAPNIGDWSALAYLGDGEFELLREVNVLVYSARQEWGDEYEGGWAEASRWITLGSETLIESDSQGFFVDLSVLVGFDPVVMPSLLRLESMVLTGLDADTVATAAVVAVGRPIGVYFTWANVGGEDVHHITLTDTTVEGDTDVEDIVWWICTNGDPSGLCREDDRVVLDLSSGIARLPGGQILVRASSGVHIQGSLYAPGEMIFGRGVLPGLARGELHGNRAQTTGRGVVTDREGSDFDYWYVRAFGPSLDIEKSHGRPLPPGQGSNQDAPDNHGQIELAIPAIEDWSALLWRGEGTFVLSRDVRVLVYRDHQTWGNQDQGGWASLTRWLTLSADTLIASDTEGFFVNLTELEGFDPTGMPAVLRLGTVVLTGLDADTIETAASVLPGLDVPVYFAITNTGDEPVTEITFTDTTIEGDRPVENIVWGVEFLDHSVTCNEDDTECLLGAAWAKVITLDENNMFRYYHQGTLGELVVLHPTTAYISHRIFGEGVLTGMEPGELHANRATVTGRGVVSDREDSDFDYWYIHTEDGPGIDVEKGHGFWLGAGDGNMGDADNNIAYALVPLVDDRNAVRLDRVSGGAFLRVTRDVTITYGPDAGEVIPAGTTMTPCPDGGDFFIATYVSGTPETGMASSMLPQVPAYRMTGVDADNIYTALLVGPGASVEVWVSFTNNRTEPLSWLRFTDTTLYGPDVTGWTCDYEWNAEGYFITSDGELLVLLPGERFGCDGILEGLEDNEIHANRARIEGIGVISGRPVEDEDEWWVIDPPLASTVALVFPSGASDDALTGYHVIRGPRGEAIGKIGDRSRDRVLINRNLVPAGSTIRVEQFFNAPGQELVCVPGNQVWESALITVGTALVDADGWATYYTGWAHDLDRVGRWHFRARVYTPVGDLLWQDECGWPTEVIYVVDLSTTSGFTGRDNVARRGDYFFDQIHFQGEVPRGMNANVSLGADVFEIPSTCVDWRIEIIPGVTPVIDALGLLECAYQMRHHIGFLHVSKPFTGPGTYRTNQFVWGGGSGSDASVALHWVGRAVITRPGAPSVTADTPVADLPAGSLVITGQWDAEGQTTGPVHRDTWRIQPDLPVTGTQTWPWLLAAGVLAAAGGIALLTTRHSNRPAKQTGKHFA